MSPVPVFDLHRGHEYADIDGVECRVSDNAYGSYFRGRVIVIEKGNDELVHLNTLAHEVGHAKCYEDGCFCFDLEENFMLEGHAMLFALRFAIDTCWDEYIKKALSDIRRHRTSKKKKYSMGAEYVMCLDEFKKAAKLADK